MFVDLTYDEVVKDVEHRVPNDDSTALARISQLFVQWLIERDGKVRCIQGF